ncbi:glycosyltransferase family 4 protein [Cognatilysobacter lacus]|uniref:Glycosyltransferase family 4 protein n=1 Tax=Cognatilysobacter lacus TaxID=1643323 RepID=A0A5D8Z8E4_9GAMM|nr:glycosyltransferase family 4 protein [Lysobacter lacus]TZF91195.1 glycosyltransferase family 4 protein [Lysobacter lacus]
MAAEWGAPGGDVERTHDARVQADRPHRIVLLCDWLPPDFGAVGQYAVGFAHELAAQGHDVALVGFSSTAGSEERERVGGGQLLTRRLFRPTYDRANLLVRGIWTVRANLALLWGARGELRLADEVRFTGSPPYLLHFVAPVALLLGLRTRYRITDFHPECLMAVMPNPGIGLRLLSRVTNFWRRRIDVIEVIGDDQGRRLAGCGIDPASIELRRDPSPVEFGPGTTLEPAPAAANGRRVILYSGNWGAAHDHATFLSGYADFCRAHPDVAFVWLNATGARLDVIVASLESMGLPFARTQPVPLERLAGVLRAADLHLITLDDRFVGYVMPSKVYACIASGRPILFVGSAESDVHALCVLNVPADRYVRVDVGDAASVASAIETLLAVSPGAASTEQRN